MSISVATACFFVLLPLATLLVRTLLTVMAERRALAEIPDLVVAWVATAVTVLMAYLPARWVYFTMHWRFIDDEAPVQCRVCGCDLSEDLMARRCPACGTVFR
jgi:hypothetical protein